MVKNKNIVLLNPSGCLTAEAMKAAALGKLNVNDTILFKKHLDQVCFLS